jgi:hypothetical protein
MMNRLPFSLAGIVAMLAVDTADATVINLNLTLDPEHPPFPGFFLDNVPVAGSFGDFWRAYLPLPPFRLQSGDRLNINLRFLDRKRIVMEDTTGAFDPFGLGAGNESTFFSVSDVNGSSGPFATFDWQMRFLGATGDLLINPAADSVTGTISDDLVANYTDSNFAFRGLRLSLDFDQLVPPNGPIITDFLQLDLLAENIRFEQVPLPESGDLWLLAFTLAPLLMASRRRWGTA